MNLANGNIPVSRSILSQGEQGIDETVAKMVDMAKGEYGARSAKIRALAINILNRAHVRNKDYYGMIEAVHNWVRDTIRYIKDPIGQETLSFPEETAFNSKAGDCDDMTILEMGILGSLGIQSYPVVVGMQPGRYSHVYLHALVPPGKGRYAGKVIAADPIMREWSLGKEAPARSVKAKKLYSELAGLDMDLGSYATGPAYLDDQNVDSVEPALRSKLTDTAGRGRVMNTEQVLRPADDLDEMFQRGGSVEMPFQQASKADLYSLGPITNQGQQVLTSFLADSKPKPLRERRAGPKIVNIPVRRQGQGQPRRGNSSPSVGELMGLSDFLSALEPLAKQASRRLTVNGKGDVMFKAAGAAVLANQRARMAAAKASAIQGSIQMFGLGAEVDADEAQLAGSIATLARAVADKAAALTRLATGGSSLRQQALRGAVANLTRAETVLGATSKVANLPPSSPYASQAAAVKAGVLATMSTDPELSKITDDVILARTADATPGSPLITPVNGTIRDRNGDAIFNDDGSLGSFFSKIKKKLKKNSPLAHFKKLDHIIKKTIVKPHLQLARGKLPFKGKLLGKKPKKHHRGQTTIYQDENGNVITEQRYNELMAQYNAAVQAPAQNAPVNQPVYSAPPVYAANQAIQATPGGSSLPTPGASMVPAYDSNGPVDTFGPDDMSAPEYAESSQESSEESGGEEPGGYADEGAASSEDDASEGVLYDEEGNPIPESEALPAEAAVVATPTSGGGFMPLALIGTAAYFLLGK